MPRRCWRASRSSAPACRSTISARAIPRSPICSDSPSIRSRSTDPSCARAARARARSFCARSSRSRKDLGMDVVAEGAETESGRHRTLSARLRLCAGLRLWPPDQHAGSAKARRRRAGSGVKEEALAMPMKNPPHPGEMIGDGLEEIGVTISAAAKGLGVTRQQLHHRALRHHGGDGYRLNRRSAAADRGCGCRRITISLRPRALRPSRSNGLRRRRRESLAAKRPFRALPNMRKPPL